MVALDFPPLPPAAETVVIQHSDGGYLDQYGRAVQAYLDAKSKVRVEGQCASACTMVTAVPADRLCMSDKAKLVFHASWTPVVAEGSVRAERSDEGTTFMSAFYPHRLKRWIASKGGLTSKLLVLQGAELRRMFRACR